MYILGGQDLNKGLYNSLWRINMHTVRDHVNQATWEKVQFRGDAPRAISHSCMFVYDSKIYVFDINGSGEDMKRGKHLRRLDTMKKN